MKEFENEELDMLTQEERQALMDEEQAEPDAVEPDIGGEEVEAALDVVPDDDKSANELENQQDEDEAVAAPEAAAAAVATTNAAAHFPTFDVPQDAQDRLSKIDEELGGLGEKFDTGDMPVAEYHRRMMALMDEKQELREQVFKSSLSQEIAQKTWFDVTVPAFLAAHPEYSENQVLYDSLNVQVQKLQSENPDKAMDASILAQAHERLAAVFNLGAAKPRVQNAEKTEREMPPNLGRVPASDMTEAADGGLFKQLDELAASNVEKYEEALSQLPEAQLEAYLKYS